VVEIAVRRKCTFDEFRNGNLCGRTMLLSGPAAFCAVHDRIVCTAMVRRNGNLVACGARLLAALATQCPECGVSVRLRDVMRRGD